MRREDTASFDTLVEGHSIPHGYVEAYIDHKTQGRVYQGYKHVNDLTGLNKYSMGLPMTRKERREVATQLGRPIEVG